MGLGDHAVACLNDKATEHLTFLGLLAICRGEAANRCGRRRLPPQQSERERPMSKLGLFPSHSGSNALILEEPTSALSERQTTLLFRQVDHLRTCGPGEINV
jgi:hypothetical protein